MLLWGNLGHPGSSDGQEFACNAGDTDSVPGLGRSLGEGNGYPLQYSCLGNPGGGGAWWTTVHGVTKEPRHNLVTMQRGQSRDRLKDAVLEDLTDEATGQGMSRASKSKKSQWMDSPFGRRVAPSTP